MPDPARRIAHIDMDAFYASVERLRYPQLRGQALVIGAGHHLMDAQLDKLRQQDPRRDWSGRDRHLIPLSHFPRLHEYTGRGVITTASYEARRFGVGSAMGLMKAARHCPDAYLLPADFDEYRRLSRMFKAIILRYAPRMENRGIDEVYADLSALPRGQLHNGHDLALDIQQAIQQETGLSCSIGVAPNKLLAKMASEFNKPAGVSIVLPDDLQTLIWPLPCKKIHGVGPRTDERLQRLDIRTIGQLAACDPAWLQKHFGEHHGSWLHEAAWGRDTRPVITESEPVSISRETTFERDLDVVADRAELSQILTGLAEELAQDLQRSNYACRTIGVKLRFANFQIVTRDASIPQYTQRASRLRRVAGLCLKRVRFEHRMRLLGLRASGLMPVDELLASKRAGDWLEPGGSLPLFQDEDLLTLWKRS